MRDEWKTFMTMTTISTTAIICFAFLLTIMLIFPTARIFVIFVSIGMAIKIFILDKKEKLRSCPYAGNVVPFIGNILDLAVCNFSFCRALRMWGHQMKVFPIFRISMIGEDFTVVQEPRLAKSILNNNNFDLPIGDNDLHMYAIKMFFGPEALALQQHHIKEERNPKWYNRRTALMSKLTTESLSELSGCMYGIIDRHMNLYRGRKFNAKDLTSTITMSIFIQLFLELTEGVDDFVQHFDSADKAFKDFQLSYMLKQIPLIGIFIGALWTHDKFLKEKDTMLKKIIEHLKNLPDESFTISHFKLDSSYDVLASRLYGIMFAGYDTTSIAMRWTFYHLHRNPEYKEYLRNIVLEHFDDTDPQCINREPLNTELDNVVNEVMRLSPPAFTLIRTAGKETTVGKGEYATTFGKGEPILLNIIHMHLSEKIWGKDAKKFNPKRWNFKDEKKTVTFEDDVTTKKAAFIPFSSGVRKCPGFNLTPMELKLFLCILLSKYTFTVHNDDDILYGDGMLNSPSDFEVTLE